jgi:hypothetical protein
MNWSQILSLASPAFGFLGAVIQKSVGIFEERQRHRNEMERLELASRIDVQKADINLRQTREDHSGAAFTAAIQAQANATPAHSWAKDVVALFRPGLTALVLSASIGQASYLMFKGVDATEFWQGIHSLASMSFGYWFGMRSFEKAPEIRLAAPVRK